MSEPALGSYSPAGIFTWHQHVRAYEPGISDRLGPGNLLRYCELIANAASTAAGFGDQWYVGRGEGWVVYRQTLELAAPAHTADLLELSTWVQSYTRVSAQRNYRVRLAATGATVARASTTWAYIDRARLLPRRIPQEILTNIPLHDQPGLPDRPAWGLAVADAPLAATSWRARIYEADRLRHINNCVYSDWLHEAASLAMAEWRTRNDALGAICQRQLLPRRMTLHYLRSAVPGDQVVLTTSPIRVGSFGLVVDQRITLADDPTALLVTGTASYLGMAMG